MSRSKMTKHPNHTVRKKIHMSMVLWTVIRSGYCSICKLSQVIFPWIVIWNLIDHILWCWHAKLRLVLCCAHDSDLVLFRHNLLCSWSYEYLLRRMTHRRIFMGLVKLDRLLCNCWILSLPFKYVFSNQTIICHPVTWFVFFIFCLLIVLYFVLLILHLYYI